MDIKTDLTSLKGKLTKLLPTHPSEKREDATEFVFDMGDEDVIIVVYIGHCPPKSNDCVTWLLGHFEFGYLRDRFVICGFIQECEFSKVS